MKCMCDLANFLAAFWALLSVHAGEPLGCKPIAGTEQLWSKPALRFVVAGEMHGTNETPAIFKDLVCSADGLKRPIIVGVELREQVAIDRFMASTNRDLAADALLSKGEWHDSDGRTSQAMLMLLEDLRALKLGGAVSGIVAFSVWRLGETAAKGEKRMASALLAAARRHPNALVIALTGNVHACKKMLPGVGSYPLMASFLPSAETVSLFVTDRGGEAWNCQGDGCRSHKLSSSGGLQREIKLSPSASPLPGYDGVLSTGLHATASPPALHPTPTSGTPHSRDTFPSRPATCPTPSAQWCVGPSAHQAFTNSSGGNENRNREFVFPTRRIGPGSDSPSAASIFSRPSAVCVTARIVTGPTFTLNSTDTPDPGLP